MPNEILNIQHTIIQLQNVEKVQAVGQQREQYLQKSEAMHQQAEKELEQTIVQISEEAEKVFLKDEEKRERSGGKDGKEEDTEAETRNTKLSSGETEEEDKMTLNIVV